jgi:hypothetical protein
MTEAATARFEDREPDFPDLLPLSRGLG